MSRQFVKTEVGAELGASLGAEFRETPLAARDQAVVKRAVVLLTLMIAGEAAFLLPFVLARIFRPTLLDVLGLTNVQLGAAFSLFGVLALVSYVPGGLLADRFSARRLMAAALITTALGGIALARTPSFRMLMGLYAFWGLTTTLLFWAAKIRATREWGGNTGQGRAFGLVEGGRGLMSALLASGAVAVFATLLPTQVATATLAQRGTALNGIIWIFTAFVLGIGLLIWMTMPETAPANETDSAPTFTWAGVRSVVRMPAIWLQGTILVCAYVFNKSTDIFSLYARDAFGYDDVAAAQITTIAFWARPFAAIVAGLLADRISASRMSLLSFCILIIGSLTITSGAIKPGLHWLLIVTVAGTSAGLAALRGIYFALLHEARVPLAITGSAVGLVSVLGYTPDVFMPTLIGYLLDRAPGAAGHQQVFGLLAAFAVVGLLATLLFQRVTRTEVLASNGKPMP